MFSIEKNGAIRLTRGDTQYINVSITNQSTGEQYQIQQNDTIRFTVKKSVTDRNFIFQKVLTGSQDIVINPEDTSEMLFQKYKYDVELTTGEGDVFTVIGPADFEVCAEVTYG